MGSYRTIGNGKEKSEIEEKDVEARKKDSGIQRIDMQANSKNKERLEIEEEDYEHRKKNPVGKKKGSDFGVAFN